MSIATRSQCMVRDFRHAARLLTASSSFTTVAVLSIALGIGANTAIFSLVDTILLRTLPVKDPSGLVVVARNRITTVSYPLYLELRDRSAAFSGLMAHGKGRRMAIRLGGREVELAVVDSVSGNFFSVLGVDAAIGRTIAPEDDTMSGGHPVAVISYGYWKRRFASDPGVTGKSLELNGYPMTIIGVAEARFTGMEPGFPTDVFVPLSMTGQIEPAFGPHWNRPSSSWLEALGRLESTQQTGPSEARADAVFRHFMQTQASVSGIPPGKKMAPPHLRLLNGSKGVTVLRKQLSQPLLLLLMVSGAVLLIACTNIASLQLARGAGRRKEMAIRLAIGASRADLIRQLSVEGLAISIPGGLAGLALSFWCMRMLPRLLPERAFPIPFEFFPDLRMLAFTFVLCTVTGILFGAVPAYLVTRLDPVASLKDAAVRQNPQGSRFGMRKGLVTLQIALSLLLLMGAGLFGRTLANLHRLERGFLLESVLAIDVDPTSHGYAPRRSRLFYERLLASVERLPGIKMGSLAFITPLSGNSIGASVSTPDYQSASAEDTLVNTNLVSPHYFETMGIPLLAGRDFVPADEPSLSSTDSPTSTGSPANTDQRSRVVIVSRTLARHYFKTANPIGKVLCLDRTCQVGNTYTIVGVVGDTKYQDVRLEPPRMLYHPGWSDGGHRTLCLSISEDPRALIAGIRRELAAIDPSIPILDARSMRNQLDASLIREDLTAMLCAFFSVLAVSLSGVGLYGLMSSIVTHRTHEIGIRLAMGATSANVLWLVLRDAAVLLLIGVSIGLPVSFAAARLARSLLYGISTYDAASLAAAVLVLTLVSTLASYLPARRAVRVDPLSSLRAD